MERARPGGRSGPGERARTQADAAYADLVPKLWGLRAGGMSLRGIVGWVTNKGHTTRRGAAWNASQVKRVLEWAWANRTHQRGGPG